MFLQKNLLESAENPPNDAIRAIAQQGDYGLCIEVLEHLDQPERLLKNLRYYLKPNATLIITVPSGKICAFEKHIGHRRHYTRKTLSELLRACGYKNYSVRAVGFPFFNVYKWISILRGRQLIADVKKQDTRNLFYYVTQLVMAAFRVLLRFNLNAIPLGWQLVAIVKVQD